MRNGTSFGIQVFIREGGRQDNKIAVCIDHHIVSAPLLAYLRPTLPNKNLNFDPSLITPIARLLYLGARPDATSWLCLDLMTHHSMPVHMQANELCVFAQHHAAPILLAKNRAMPLRREPAGGPIPHDVRNGEEWCRLTIVEEWYLLWNSSFYSGGW